MASYKIVLFRILGHQQHWETLTKIWVRHLANMRRSLLLLLLLVLIQLNTSHAKEDVSSSEKETKTTEKEAKSGEKEEKISEKGEKDKDEEEEEDTCLSSPCGSHARCKNVQVCLGVHTWGKNATNVIICGSRVRCENVQVCLFAPESRLVEPACL